MIITVCPNPAVDLTWHVDRLSRGETVSARPASSRAGGKAVNVARVLHSRGHKSVVVAPMGGELRSVFEEDLRRADISYTVVPVEAALRRTAALVETDFDTVTLLSEPGGPLTPQESAALSAAVLAHLPRAHALVISGSLPRGLESDFVAEITRSFRDAGVPVIADVQGPALLASAAAGASVLKPNREELAAAVGHERVLDAMQELLDLGAGTVFCSLGADGIVALDRASTPQHGRLDSPLSGNATGAGDAAVAAIAAGLVAGSTDLVSLLRAACSWSAAAVASPLAGDSDAALSERLSRHVRVRDITPPHPEALL